ncbi:MAG TPA: hypothetical protein VFE47_14005 [Tepidisphaeraceae bacterium]|jgi:hypothetical protein|nr:hypothetical protein [Tepidisphaeraceae bacterium]
MTKWETSFVICHLSLVIGISFVIRHSESIIPSTPSLVLNTNKNRATRMTGRPVGFLMGY